MQNENDSILSRLATLEGEMLAHQVLLKALLPSIDLRQNSYVSKFKTLKQDTASSLQAEPEKLRAFNRLIDEIGKELQVT